jgi:hypothetical protein
MSVRKKGPARKKPAPRPVPTPVQPEHFAKDEPATAQTVALPRLRIRISNCKDVVIEECEIVEVTLGGRRIEIEGYLR